MPPAPSDVVGLTIAEPHQLFQPNSATLHGDTIFRFCVKFIRSPGAPQDMIPQFSYPDSTHNRNSVASLFPRAPLGKNRSCRTRLALLRPPPPTTADQDIFVATGYNTHRNVVLTVRNRDTEQLGQVSVVAA